jgi:cytochrome c2
MRKLSFLTTAICIILFSCNKNTKTNLNAVFNESNLQQQLFDINITRDTTLLTVSGCIIKVPAGSLQSDNNNVKLEIKEAINLKDILLAGLTTMSGKQTLSSAGMIYINAAEGTKVEIKKALEVLVPIKMFNPNMQVYKGTKLDNGKIDWQNPTPLAEDETIKKISVGEQIFKANCSNCHKIDGDYTGPSLLGVTYRRPKKWLYDFMKSPANMIATDCNSKELFNKWKPTIMTAFPVLEDGGGLDSVFAYIKSETDKRGLGHIKYEKTCCDSCYDYKEALKKVNKNRNELIEKNGDLFNLDRVISVPNNPLTDTLLSNISIDIENTKNYITPTSVKATYYTIKIEAFGWFNLDFCTRGTEGCKESELFVNIKGTFDLEYNANLIIPNKKIFVEGGKLDNNTQYGFSEANGKIILPQNEKCIIVAFAQYKDNFIFGKASFNSSTRQTISLSTKEITKIEMEKEFSLLGLEDVKMEVNKSKNADKIRNADTKLGSLKKLLPKNCDCQFENASPIKADTSVLYVR